MALPLIDRRALEALVLAGRNPEGAGGRNGHAVAIGNM